MHLSLQKNSQSVPEQSKKHSDASSKNSLRNRRNNRLVQVLGENNGSPATPDHKKENRSSDSSKNVDQNIVYNLMRQNTKNSNKPLSDNSHTHRTYSNRTLDDKIKSENNSNSLLNLPHGTDRKGSEASNRTHESPDINRKFSQLQFGPASQHRSRSFTRHKEHRKHKKCKKKHKKHKNNLFHQG